MKRLPGLSGPSRFSRLFILLGATIPLVLIGLAVVAILHSRTVALNAAVRANQSTGVILAEQAERTMQAVDLVMQEATVRFDAIKVNTDAQFSEAFSSLAVHDFLADRMKNLPQADALTVIDARGRLVNFSRYWPIPELNFTDRDYYRYFDSHNDPGVFVSAPVENRGDGTWTLYLVRRINGADGTFVGMILGAIKLAYFADLYKKITPPDGGTTELLRRDGTILVRFPQDEMQVGVQFERRSPWFDLVAAGGGNFRSPGYVHHNPRLVAAHPMNSYPLVVNTTLREDAVLAQWRQESIFTAVGTAIVSIALMICLFVLNLQLGRLERGSALLSGTAGALRASEKLLAEKSATLELTLDQMDQGLIMIDADGIVAVSNRRVREILNIPDALMRTKPKFQDLLAYQFTHKNFDPRLRSLKCAEIMNQPSVYDRLRPDGRVIEVRSMPLAAGGAVRTYTDISARKAAEEQTRYLAQHDGLTRLANRAVLLEHLNRSIGRAGEPDARGLAVLFMDLDRFKLVNDTRGHQVGDRLLAQVADRIRATLRDTDLAARMGGDEFAVIQSGVDQPSSALALARRLLGVIGAPYEIHGQISVIGISIGLAVFPADGTAADQLLRNADTALYRAKEDGRNNVRSFEPAMDIRQQERSLLEHDLREAVQRRQFTLAFQPICDPATRDIMAFEALLRWNHPQRGPIAPDQFIPLAESSGLIVPLGLWVLETACTEAVSWAQPVRVAVNLSPVQFRQSNLAQEVAGVLLRTGLPGTRLKLEVTEGLLLDDATVVLNTMHALRQQGILIALDDFGTGHASLSYLRRFPFDHIKIDRSFVHDMIEDPESRAIVEAVLALGARLHLKVVAEGVETEEQLALLQRLQCDYVQGYLIGRPMGPAEARALLQSSTSAKLEFGNISPA